jgi:hypothetical protein
LSFDPAESPALGSSAAKAGNAIAAQARRIVDNTADIRIRGSFAVERRRYHTELFGGRSKKIADRSSYLWLRHRSGGRSPLAILMLMATAVVHLYGTAIYLETEALDGYPNVRTTSFIDFALEFWLLNGLWLVMPWTVLYWGKQTLYEQLGSSGESAGRGFRPDRM